MRGLLTPAVGMVEPICEVCCGLMLMVGGVTREVPPVDKILVLETALLPVTWQLVVFMVTWLCWLPVPLWMLELPVAGLGPRKEMKKNKKTLLYLKRCSYK